MVDFTVVKLLFAVLVDKQKWVHRYLDVKNAYLYGILKECVYLEQPEGWVEGDANKVWKLKKSLYGLHQSGHNWYKELSGILERLGFKKLNRTDCVYKFGNDAIIAVYVDDFAIFAKNNYTIKRVVSILQKELEMKDLGQIRRFLGVNFVVKDEKVYLNQRDYIYNTAREFCATNVK